MDEIFLNTNPNEPESDQSLVLKQSQVAKAYRLFTIQMNELLLAKKLKAGNGQISPPDAEKLHAVRQFVEEKFAEKLSLSELSLKFRLNEFKLKKGYKLLFNKTVFGHIYELRMQEAQQLLLTGRYNIAEVAYQVGYNSPNNFSTAFHKMLGYPPSRMLRRAG
jgi:AraC family transcriptional regulator, transcriptional activator of the genes for pyochelin and ferripyochelin receptors